MSQIFRPRLLGVVSCIASTFLATPGYAADKTITPDSTDVASADIATVTVTGSPLTQDADALATVVDSVDKEQILRAGGANLADALANVPGVTGTGFASGASRPVIRGFDATRVRVLEDGIDSFDVSDIGPDHGVPIDPMSAQSIEVVRGAGTLRYGSQAIGGGVNAINNRVPLDLPEAPISGDVTGSYDSNGHTGQGAGEVDGRVGSFALHADGFDRRADDYDTPHGTQDNSFFHGDGYSVGSSYFFGDDNASRIGGAVIHYDARYGIPADTVYIDMKQTKELLRSSFAINSGALQTLTVDGGYASYQHTENNPDGSVNSTFRNKAWDSRAEALFGAIGPFSRSALGMQLQHRDFSALGEDSDYLFPTTTRSYAAFAFTEAPLADWLRLQSGARVERVGVDGTPSTDVATTRDFTPLSASLGLVADASQAVRFGLTLSSTARAPAQTELFARGPHDGPGTFETGDPTLGIERSNSLEATMRVRMDKVRLDGSVWAAKFNNYIYGALTGRTCDDDDNCVVGDSEELKELNYTQLDATFRGAEAKATIGLYQGGAGKLDARLLADYVRATLDSGGNVPRIPPYHVGGGLDWERGSVDAGFLLKYAGAQHDTAEAETDTKGFVSLDAQVGWRLLPARPGLEVALVGHNLTNTTQRNAVALNKEDVLMPGRNVSLIVRADF
ncbi:TonB-dependent receptor [Solimonas terrae]|uniref:TonB-dependent receptor n=1 Tax=Solimonas terrae TaxID=1396819 RepID=A0A6M2BV51_9GAMM|nr:TonB-dependent receptor [Solimonas terrae]NGY06368.1 TonB-dependent receptor [Solimonas terrae]